MTASEKLPILEDSESDSEHEPSSSVAKDSPDAHSSTKSQPEFREVQLGIWTLYFPITNSWRHYFPALESLWLYVDLIKGLPIVWKFILETLSLAPFFFAVYFAASTLVSFESAFRLYNNSRILAFVSARQPNIFKSSARNITIS